MLESLSGEIFSHFISEVLLGCSLTLALSGLVVSGAWVWAPKLKIISVFGAAKCVSALPASQYKSMEKFPVLTDAGTRAKSAEESDEIDWVWVREVEGGFSAIRRNQWGCLAGGSSSVCDKGVWAWRVLSVLCGMRQHVGKGKELGSGSGKHTITPGYI